eukprot:UN17571
MYYKILMSGYIYIRWFVILELLSLKRIQQIGRMSWLAMNR